MNKPKTLAELQQEAVKVLNAHPKELSVFATEDGNIFLAHEKGSAIIHARNSKLAAPVEISRDDVKDLKPVAPLTTEELLAKKKEDKLQKLQDACDKATVGVQDAELSADDKKVKAAQKKLTDAKAALAAAQNAE